MLSSRTLRLAPSLLRSAASGTKASAINGVSRRTFQATAWNASPEAAPEAAAEAPAVEAPVEAPVFTPEPRPEIIWTTHRLNKDQITKVDGIFHKILWLDMFETSMLNDCINERLGLVLTGKQRTALQRQLKNRAGAVGDGGGKAAAAPEVEAGPVLVDLKLAGFDSTSKIKVIKEVRSIAMLGLKEAKELVEGFPKIIMKQIKPEQAEELKAKLEAVGAIIELV
jgi:large subunit ribosomal protein L7/L12